MPKPRRCTTSRRGSRLQKRKNGGGCNCLFSGGSGTLALGAGPGLSQLNNSAYYPFNTHNGDPNYSAVAGRQTDAFLVKGGRKTRGRPLKGRKTRREKYCSKHCLRRKRGVRGGSSGTLVGQTIDTLKSAVSSTLVGANSFGGTTYVPDYVRYTPDNTPYA